MLNQTGEVVMSLKPISLIRRRPEPENAGSGEYRRDGVNFGRKKCSAATTAS